MNRCRVDLRPLRGPLRVASAREAGFSLMELMIVVAIMGILVAIALPSYAGYLRRSARAEAQTVLTDLAAREAQYLVDRRSYAGTVAALNYSIPGDLAAKFTFAIAVVAGPPPTFTITATAQGDQAKDLCPTLTLNSGGTRTPSTCW